MKILSPSLVGMGLLFLITQSSDIRNIPSQQYCAPPGRSNAASDKPENLRSSFNENSTKRDRYLFAITVKGKTGFIDSAGSVIVTPQYETAEEFSEGFCAVRLHGVYGFIDTKGDMVVQPDFDYATQFREGFAMVYKNGRPFFIDKRGNQVIAPVFAQMTHFSEGRAYVKTKSGKMGVIDKSGKLIIDTLYRRIGEFKEGQALVEGLNHEPYGSKEKPQKLEVGVISIDGKMIVQYGKYDEIKGPSEGYYTATIPAKNKNRSSEDVILNSEGSVTHSLKDNDYTWFEGPVSNGIIRVNFPQRTRRKSSSGDSYDAYITPFGKIVYNNKEVESGHDFFDNHAFCKSESKGYSVINRLGEEIVRNSFNRLMGEGFKKGMALVETDKGWGIIDTTAQFILQPTFKEVHDVGILDGFLFFEDPEYKNSWIDDTVSTYTERYPRYGMADIKGNIIIPAKFQFFDPRGFINGLMKAWVDEKITYFNKGGEVIWQEEKWEEEELQSMNIDYMNRGYFYAGEVNTGHGGRGFRSESQKIGMLNSFSSAALSLSVDADSETEFVKGIKGMMAYVANTTGDTVIFNAQDSRLYMKIQAKDSDGQWRDIEYLPGSWCGNSYHSLRLLDNHYWAFVAPVYEGSFHTQLRIELKYVDPTDTVGLERRRGGRLDWTYRNRRQLILYSNEFEGSVNPAQFWRKREYYASNIMDPYEE